MEHWSRDARSRGRGKRERARGLCAEYLCDGRICKDTKEHVHVRTEFNCVDDVVSVASRGLDEAREPLEGAKRMVLEIQRKLPRLLKDL